MPRKKERTRGLLLRRLLLLRRRRRRLRRRRRRKQRRGALTNHNRHGAPEVREEDEQRVARLGRQLVVAPLELALLDHVRRQAPLAVRRLRELALLVRRHLRRHARALRRAVQQRLPAGGRAGGRRRGGREGVRDCGGRAEAPRQRRRRTPAARRRRPHFALAPPAILDEGLKSASSTSVSNVKVFLGSLKELMCGCCRYLDPSPHDSPAVVHESKRRNKRG